MVAALAEPRLARCGVSTESHGRHPEPVNDKDAKDVLRRLCELAAHSCKCTSGTLGATVAGNVDRCFDLMDVWKP